jgi:dolichol-phosphate mannosyltransferase
MSGKQRTVTVVIPTLNEARNLAELTGRLFRAFDSGGLNGEVIIVDDDSQDGTVELCEELADRFNIRLITRNGERGLATAALFGMRAANGETIVVMDADLSHPPESLPELVQACNGDTDCGMAVASRYVVGGTLDPSWGRWRHVNSWVATRLARGLTRVADPMWGFF